MPGHPAQARALASPVPRPPIRIRTVLLFALIGLVVWTGYPRAAAAIKLHGTATSAADYALCMVGPTGPALLRDNLPEFRRTVRRRLITCNANERPFQQCAKAAREITGSIEVERAHLATAWSFVEYGGVAADRPRATRGVGQSAQRAAPAISSELTLDALAISTRPLAELAHQAWPFVRGGYTRLFKPNLRAHEAVHPIDLPRPAIGSGLPAFRTYYRAALPVEGGVLLAVGQGAHFEAFQSGDGGVTFRRSGARDPRLADVAERCPAGEPGRGYTLGLSDDGASTVVASLGPDAAPHVAPLAPADLELAAVACDARALVAVLEPASGRDARLVGCAYRGACQQLEFPRFSGVGAVPHPPLDVARVDGTTIVAVVMHGIVRTSSSRDDGRTWAPFSVAFDSEAHPELRTPVGVPSKLLVVGKRVLLLGASVRPGQTYPVVASDDQGASWRTP